MCYQYANQCTSCIISKYVAGVDASKGFMINEMLRLKSYTSCHLILDKSDNQMQKRTFLFISAAYSIIGPFVV